MNIKNAFISFIINLFLLLTIAFLFIFPESSINAVKNALLLCYNNVMPSIFPFLIVSSMLMDFSFVEFLAKPFGVFMNKVFNIRGEGAFAFLIGIISGYPLGAKMVSSLRVENKISLSEANRLITFTNNAGPLFILSSVGVSIFANQKLGYFLILIQIISSILNGILFKFIIKNDDTIKQNRYSVSKNTRSFSESLDIAIANSLEAILSIAGYLIFFSLLLNILKEINFFNFIANFLNRLDLKNIDFNYIEAICTGLIEMTNAIVLLSKSKINERLLFSSLSFLINFSGLCIIFQSIKFIRKSDISIFIFILGKFIQGLISFFLTYFLYPFFNLEPKTVDAFSSTIVSKQVDTFSYFLLFAILFVFIINKKRLAK